MDDLDILVSDLIILKQVKIDTVTACCSDDDCGCEGGEGSCECGYDPECE